MNITYDPALVEFWVMHYFEFYPPSIMVAAANNCFGYSPSHESALTTDHWQAYASNNGPESTSSSLFTTEPTREPHDKDFDAKPEAKNITARRVYECLGPVTVKYQLEDHRFRLIYIYDSVDSGIFRGRWLFVGVLSPEWDRALNAFLVGPILGRLGPVPELETAHALGDPVAEDAVTDHHIVVYNYWIMVKIGPSDVNSSSVYMIMYSDSNDNTEMREVTLAGTREFRSHRVLALSKELAREVGADLKFVPVGKLPEAREELEEIMTCFTLVDLDEEVNEAVNDEGAKESGRKDLNLRCELRRASLAILHFVMRCIELGGAGGNPNSRRDLHIK
ncbi:hypothetical protein DL771_006243 [Monosporascus sp. 5C6A]|nr:hypothetical protein DL771_006243 [Monosporascus sp. 5C6A]